jgi:lipoprotein NlpD
LLALLLVVAGCTTYAVRAPVGDRTDSPARKPDTHQVRRGDTLYSIAFLYGFSIEELAAWNGLGPPYTIYRGQTLRLVPPHRQVARAAPPPPASRPKPRLGAPVRSSPPSTSVSQPKLRSLPKTTAPVRADPPPVAGAAPVSEPVSRPAKVAVTSAPPAPPSAPEPRAADPHVFWSWPADGRLIRGYDAGSAGKKGIYIAGEEGEPVRAAAAGKVVYSGSGLSGYGRLIIIKHNNDFLSAYAHNRKLIAKEGQWVKKGEVIAQMGNTDTDRTQLHFEIRKRGRPVDPLHHLPRRQGAGVVGEKH